MYNCSKYRETIWQNLPLKTKNKPKKKKNTPNPQTDNGVANTHLVWNSEKLPLDIKKGTGMSTVTSSIEYLKAVLARAMQERKKCNCHYSEIVFILHRYLNPICS